MTGHHTFFKIAKPVIVLLFVALSLGCSATGPLFQQSTEIEPTRALVYLYRPSAFRGSGVVPPVYVDDVKLFELPNGGYAEMQLAPGSHTIETRESENILTSDAVGNADIQVQAGEVYYIRWSYVLDSFGIAITPIPVAYGNVSGSFQALGEAQALPEISLCKKVYPQQ